MNSRFLYVFFVLLGCVSCSFTSPAHKATLKFFNAADRKIQYTGRIDYSNPLKPRIWAPGVYIEAKFKGSTCVVLLNDEVVGGNTHNYLEIVIDGKNPYRVQTTGKMNRIALPSGLPDTEHTVLICKDTESNIGYIDFVGFECEQLLPLPAKSKHKIEYFGDSITSGTGMDESVIPCGKGQWYDEHNAYMSYGALTSRNLDAQWQLTALAGVGLVHSCCDMKVLMPVIYDKVFLYADSIAWDFKAYQPDVVTICLGQNDGVQDSTLFCGAYIKFVNNIRARYPKADIICLTSPMGDRSLIPALKRYLTAVTDFEYAAGDKKVHRFFFAKQYNHGCGGHPDLNDHKLIAGELTAYIKQLKGW